MPLNKVVGFFVSCRCRQPCLFTTVHVMERTYYDDHAGGCPFAIWDATVNLADIHSQTNVYADLIVSSSNINFPELRCHSAMLGLLSLNSVSSDSVSILGPRTSHTVTVTGMAHWQEYLTYCELRRCPSVSVSNICSFISVGNNFLMPYVPLSRSWSWSQIIY